VRIARDARLFLRDWTMLSDVLMSAALWTLLPFVGLSLPAGRGPLVDGLALLALAVALGYEVAARALPFEREGGAWRRLAPVSAWRWTLAKLAGAALVAAPILLVASLAIALPLRRVARRARSRPAIAIRGDAHRSRRARGAARLGAARDDRAADRRHRVAGLRPATIGPSGWRRSHQ